MISHLRVKMNHSDGADHDHDERRSRAPARRTEDIFVCDDDGIGVKSNAFPLGIRGYHWRWSAWPETPPPLC